MKYRVRIETTHKELFNEIRDEIRQICMEYSIPITADLKNSSNIHQVNLKAEVRSNTKLEKDNLDGSNIIEL